MHRVRLHKNSLGYSSVMLARSRQFIWKHCKTTWNAKALGLTWHLQAPRQYIHKH